MRVPIQMLNQQFFSPLRLILTYLPTYVKTHDNDALPVLLTSPKRFQPCSFSGVRRQIDDG